MTHTRTPAIFLFVFFFIGAIYSQNQVDTEYGPVIGSVTNGVRVWQGIPYASPPVGNLRFKAPQPPTPWSKPIVANDWLKICPQNNDFLGTYLGTEDCLYLDVYAPENATKGSNLPVMVWIYGGGFIFGDKYEFGLYDAKNLVLEKGHVHVAMNYRLSALGFLALPELQMEDEFNSTGNYGLLDQTFALEWVQRNIANFGGDPNKVTIFGESAGAMSVCWHMASPKSKGLFRAGIMESGSCDCPYFFRDYNDAVSWSYNWASILGCTDKSTIVSCLRGKSASDILVDYPTVPPNFGFVPTLYPFMPWSPVIDGSPAGLPTIPLQAIEANQSTTPLIIGTNNNEGGLFVFSVGDIVPGVIYPIISREMCITALNHFFNQTITNQIMLLYDDSNGWDALVTQVLTDFIFACPSRRAARALSRNGIPTYLYHFTFPADWIDDELLGDYHSAELEFVYSNAWPPIVHQFDQKDQQMANSFGNFWTNMAYYQSPNAPTNNTIIWPPYTSTKLDMRMDVPLSIEVDYRANFCDFWDAVQTKK